MDTAKTGNQILAQNDVFSLPASQKAPDGITQTAAIVNSSCREAS